MFEVCLESFGAQRKFRNHLRTSWEHLEAIFRTKKTKRPFEIQYIAKIEGQDC